MLERTVAIELFQGYESSKRRVEVCNVNGLRSGLKEYSTKERMLLEVDGTCRRSKLMRWTERG